MKISQTFFRKRVREALKIAKGKKRAQEILTELGLNQAWEVYNAGVTTDTKYEERVIVDMVQKLIRYANLSDKQASFLKVLLDKVNGRAELERQRAAERANAAECPTGRLKFKGVIISIKEQDGFYGHELKMLVKSETGFMAWGSVPRNLRDVSRGEQIEFEANFSQSKKDAKFGFFKRPTKAKCTGKMAEGDLEEILEQTCM